MRSRLRALPRLRAAAAGLARAFDKEGKRLIDQVADLRAPVFVLTGGTH